MTWVGYVTDFVGPGGGGWSGGQEKGGGQDNLSAKLKQKLRNMQFKY
jgi:hypothetical protein